MRGHLPPDESELSNGVWRHVRYYRLPTLISVKVIVMSVTPKHVSCESLFLPYVHPLIWKEKDSKENFWGTRVGRKGMKGCLLLGCLSWLGIRDL